MKISSEAALADLIATTTEPLSIQGGGTRGFDATGKVVDLSGLNGISLYEPGALTIVARAGTPVADIGKMLAKENQRLAFEPMDHRGLLGRKGTPTIGGIVAANVSGPRRISVGAARDFTLGVRFVDGSGSIIKNGGRVMKNVTGYDLVKLMCGSYGTLGALTEVALKVLPRPETEATLALAGLSNEAAVQALADAIGSPFEVTGAAHVPGTATYFRIEGFASSVAYRIEALRGLLKPFEAKADVIDRDPSSALWAEIRDVAAFHGAEGDVWRVSCKPSDGPALAEKAKAEETLFDWAGGLIWLRTAPGTDLRARLSPFDGHATLVRAGEDTRSKLGVFQPEAPGIAKITAGLRQRFDPRGVLNQGLMGLAA